MTQLYDAAFYKTFRELSYRSAREMVPLILHMMPVDSVCDVGCGNGAWLRVFREEGVTDVMGIDGEYIPKNLLQIPVTSFHAMNLYQRISLQRSFDLAISLEFAEHLPESRAATFVEDLTRLAPVTLFSAAIPGQGGRNHVNEQWHNGSSTGPKCLLNVAIWRVISCGQKFGEIEKLPTGIVKTVCSSVMRICLNLYRS